MAQLLERLVDQSSKGNDQSTDRMSSHEDPQELFRLQRPHECLGTSDPHVAERWIKSLEVISEYLQLAE
ncbi:hypothetical protein F511_28991 [Dorcoceras hygrometricum]|uniref:Uncharacterized protein n=1 Tax=Dorcoceras hygrometricum TaxID=472368 RepID=A0A2Z7ADK2_9LAMI|nr:hypothetical protein F511_28991 [Dorcoceras hygrometricum]